MKNKENFSDYQEEGHLWITLSTGDYYPDMLPLASELYKPVLVIFGHLLKSSHSSTDLFMSISEEKPQWMRIQLCRVFRKYVSPETPVEMLKKKSVAKKICEQFGIRFRNISEVQSRFESRPMPDETLCAILWEYKDRGRKGYNLTERLFSIMQENYSSFTITGPERAGKFVLMGELFENYPNAERPVDFVLFHDKKPVAIGLTRYDSGRSNAQEEERIAQYRDCANEVLTYAKDNNLNLKIIFLNDGPGLLLGSIWKDYAQIEESWNALVKVVTLRMITERITMSWLLN